MPCTILLLSFLTFQSILLVRMRVRRSLPVPWLKTHLLPTLMEMKKMMSHSVLKWPDLGRRLLVRRLWVPHLVLESGERPLLEDLSEGH
jgi:hypothetical protein